MLSKGAAADVPESIFPVSFCVWERLDVDCEKPQGAIESPLESSMIVYDSVPRPRVVHLGHSDFHPSQWYTD